jgi:broad specificity phosphatase PhoE
VSVEARLCEIDCGAADGLSVRAVQERYPREWARNLEEVDPDFRWPGGESYRELRARSLCAVRDIAAAHRGQRVVVVTHAGVISQLLGWLAGHSAARWSPLRPRNGSVTELAWCDHHAPRAISIDLLPAERALAAAAIA